MYSSLNSRWIFYIQRKVRAV